MASVSHRYGQPRLALSGGNGYRRRSARTLIFLFLLAFLGSAPVTNARGPQAGNFIITGTVTLPDGTPAVHIKVRISGLTGLNLESTTDGSGRYQFQVPGGRYRLVATNPQDSGQYTDPVEADTSRTAGNRLLVHMYLRAPRPEQKKGSRPGVISLAEASQKIPKDARKAFDEGVRRKSEKQIDKALESFTRAIDSYPEYFQAMSERGELYISKSRIADAIQEFERALKLNEDYGPALRGLGYCSLEQQKFADAVQYLERAKTLEPGVANTHLFLGIASLALDNREAARLALQEALKMDSKGAVTAHVYLADLYAREERYKDAANELRTYLDARPDAPNASKLRAKESELRAQAKKK